MYSPFNGFASNGAIVNKLYYYYYFVLHLPVQVRYVRVSGTRSTPQTHNKVALLRTHDNTKTSADVALNSYASNTNRLITCVVLISNTLSISVSSLSDRLISLSSLQLHCTYYASSLYKPFSTTAR